MKWRVYRAAYKVEHDLHTCWGVVAVDWIACDNKSSSKKWGFDTWEKAYDFARYRSWLDNQYTLQ